MSMELSNYLASWVATYLGDLQPTYIGVIIYLLISSMDILVGAHLVGFGDKFTYNKLSGVPYCCGNIFLVSTKSQPPGLAVGAHRMSYTLRFLYLGRTWKIGSANVGETQLGDFY